MKRRELVAKEFQNIGLKFLYETLRANLWSHMGMGKTATCLMLVDLLKIAGSSFFPVLVIAPKRVCELVWPAEVLRWDRFADITVSLVLGNRKEREDALLVRADVYVINYDNIQWLVEHYGDRWPFRIVIADESTRLKNFRTKQGGARSGALGTIAKGVGRWINLTGTPSPNGLRDLWGQTWFIDFGSRLGSSYSAFLKRWFHTDPYTKVVTPLAGAEKEIHEKLADCTLALRAEDWFNIHEPITMNIPVQLPPAAMRLYEEMERDFFISIGTTNIVAVNAMAKSQKLLQMANGCVYDGASVPHQVHEAKIEGLQSVVEDMGGEPIIVTYFYKFDIPMIKKAFPKARIFDGQQAEDDWNAGRVEMLLLHPQSAAHGVNLQHGGRCMVFFAHMWDLELRLQAIERIGPTRQAQSGYNRAVLIYNLVAQNTMDEVVLDRLDGKKSVQDALMAARARRKL
jgi:SNF2 family DNA or RNA helicase